MLTYVKSNLFESPAQVIVNTVNTVGVMGKGLAKAFKDIYPEMFTQYQVLCEGNHLSVGKLWIYKTSNKWVLNFPTKQHWRSPSKIEYIEAGLKKFVETYSEKGITSISFPLLGCGNGGLDWEGEVQPLMEKYLRPLPIDIFIHLNDTKSKAEHININETKQWLRSDPSQLSFAEVWEDILEIIQSPVSNKSYSIELVQDEYEEQLIFLSNERHVVITKGQFADLWRYLRGVGFCTWQGLPSGLFEYGKLIFDFLSQLPYIEIISLSHQFSNEDDLKDGIRLKPGIQSKMSTVAEDSNHEK